MNDAVPSVPKDENSFDAVAIIKRKTDEYNPYYIYRVNTGLCNNTSDYVFKSSREMVQIAMMMDMKMLRVIHCNWRTVISMQHTKGYKASSPLDCGLSTLL